MSLQNSCFPGDILLCQQTVNHPQIFAGLSFDAFLFIHLLLQLSLISNVLWHCLFFSVLLNIHKARKLQDTGSERDAIDKVL